MPGRESLFRDFFAGDSALCKLVGAVARSLMTDFEVRWPGCWWPGVVAGFAAPAPSSYRTDGALLTSPRSGMRSTVSSSCTGSNR